MGLKRCLASGLLLLIYTIGATEFSLSPVTATYLGADTTDEALGVDIAPDGAIVVAGRFTGWSPGDVVLSVGNSTTGAIVRFASEGRSVLSYSRIGAVVSDLEIAENGKIAVCGDFGVALLSLDASSVLWSKAGSYTRVAVAGDGSTIGALRSDRALEVYSAAGTLLGSRSNSDREVNDVAVDGASRTVIITGFNNETTGRPCDSFGNCPVQVAFLRAYSYDCQTQKWKAYNWPGPWMDGADPVHNQAGNIMADTRGYRLAIGNDGKLYYGGESAGGNMVYFYDPVNFGVPVNWSRYDNYSNAWNAGADHVTFIGKYEPATGALINGQLIFPRDPATNKTKTHRPRGIDADERGNVYVTGMTNCCIEHRDSSQVCGSPVAARIGTELYLAIIDSGFTKRRLWTVFTDGPLASGYPWGSGVAVRANKAALSGVVNCAQKTCQAIKSAPAPTAGRTDGYLVVWNTATPTKTAPRTVPGSDPESKIAVSGGLISIAAQGPVRMVLCSMQGRTIAEARGFGRISMEVESGTYVLQTTVDGCRTQRFISIRSSLRHGIRRRS